MSIQKTLLAASLVTCSSLLATGCGSGAAGTATSELPANAPPASTVNPGGPSTQAPGAPTTSNGSGTDANAPSVPPTTTSTSAPAQVGETCTSGDASKICLALHFVAYKDSSGTPVATTDQATTIVHTTNQLWSQCDIGFQIEKYETVDPTPDGLIFGAASQNQLDQIRQAFQSPTNELLVVTTGPWGTAVNAWTNIPGDGIYGSIEESSIVGYGNGIIYAHELGHYLGLDHVADVSDLMNPIIYTTSTALSSAQCKAARQVAASDWSAMIRK